MYVSILTSRASSLLHKPGQGPSEATITRKAHSRRCFSCPRITNTRWLLGSADGVRFHTIVGGVIVFVKEIRLTETISGFLYIFKTVPHFGDVSRHKLANITFERTSAKKNVHRVSLFPSLDLVPPQKGQKWRYDGFSDWAQNQHIQIYISCKYISWIHFKSSKNASL